MSKESRIADRFDIQDTVYRWARAVDRRDWDLVRTVFHPDAYDEHGMYRGGVEGLLAWLHERHQVIEQSMHHVGNVLIEFSGQDDAVAESYIVAFQRYRAVGTAHQAARIAALGAAVGSRDVAIDATMPARYVDHFQRRAGEWRILKRITVFEGRYLREADATPLDPAWTGPRRDADDALYKMRAELGLAGSR